jgi:DNA polymerase I
LGRDDLPGQTLLLLDGNSLINRAYFGLLGRQTLTGPDGTPTGALFAFYNMYLKYAEEIKPTHAAAAFDLKEPTFRHQQFAGYKAARKPMPDELAVQIPLMKELLATSGVRCVETPGYEADDLIGTLAALGESGQMTVYIITGDKDSLQLVSDAVTVLLPTTKSGRTETERYDTAAICRRYQITPGQMVDLKAIMGDPSDNIPGVKGIGEKGAVDLISKYGSLDGVYSALPEIKAALADKLRENRDMAFLSRRLSEISRSAPVESDLSFYQLQKPDSEALRAILTRLGFKNILNRLKLVPERSDAPADERQDFREANLADWAGSLDGQRGLPGLWINRNLRAAWSADIGDTVLLPAGKAREAWDVLQNQPFRIAVYDYKSILRETGYPDLAGGVHDVLIAAYLLNQIDGRPDLERIYERASGQLMPGALREEKKAGASPDAGGGYVQNDLFSQMTEADEPSASPENAGMAGTQEDPADLALRASLVREAARRQQEEIKGRQIEYLAYEVEMPLISILAGMEKRGFAIDAGVLEALSTEMGERLEVLSEEIYKSSGQRFNLNSPRQLGEVLYRHLGLSTGKKAGSGAFSTDSDELDRLSGEHPVIPLIIEHRQTAKLRSTYLEGLKKVLDPSDGRVHTTFNQALTMTGRLSSSEPNLQNIPIRMEAGQKIRKAFVAKPGHVLIDADYSQIELRLLAHLSGDPAMIDSFLRSEDIHMNTACRIFNLEPKDITPRMRGIAKTMNFSIVYGISDFGLARDLGVSVRQAHHYIEDYEQLYPMVRPYLNSLVESAYRDGYVETYFGRRRYIPELKSPNRNLRQFGERAAMNTPIQGTAADLIKIAMIRADRLLQEAGLAARLILQVHDELIVEAPAAEAKEASALLKEAMTGAAELTVPLVAEVHQGLNWADSK